MTREEAISEWTFRSNYIKKWLDEYGEEPSIRHYVELIDMAIEALQTDFVRCKDCKYYNNDYMGEWCGRHQAPVWVKENDFCSWGEMKGGDSE